MAFSLVAITACAASVDDAPQPPAEITPVTLTLPASTRDSTATLSALASFTNHVDADTARMVITQRQLEMGAGATGTLTAWRAGTSWQRLHVDGEGTGFRTNDTYWLHDGALVGARLELTRPDRPSRVDQVWFRGAELYRWIDADGRALSSGALSTKSEVSTLRDRVSRIVQLLPSQDSVPGPPASGSR